MDAPSESSNEAGAESGPGRPVDVVDGGQVDARCVTIGHLVPAQVEPCFF